MSKRGGRKGFSDGRPSGASESDHPNPVSVNRPGLPPKTKPDSTTGAGHLPPNGDRPLSLQDALRGNASLDPWAEDEPVFGARERAHALSPNPGTPPRGNRAVQNESKSDDEPTTQPKPKRRKTRFLTAGDKRRFAFESFDDDGAPLPRSLSSRIRKVPQKVTRVLGRLRNSVRVEIEVGKPGKWLCGLCERASEDVAEISLRSAVWHGFGLPPAGERVRILVSPRFDQPFSLAARVVPPQLSDARPGAFTMRVSLEAQDPVLLSRWMRIVEDAGTE